MSPQLNPALFLTLFLSTLIGVPVLAEGGRVGNGGNVIVCPGARPKVLDIYEALDRRQIVYDFGDPSLDPVTKVKNVLQQLVPLAPTLAKQWTAQADDFMTKDAVFPEHV